MAPKVQPFSLHSATPRTLVEYWLPLVDQIRSEGILLCDLTRIIEQCDPLTAQLLRRLFDWADKKSLHDEVFSLRQAALPNWKYHLDLAINFSKSAHKSLSAEQFIDRISEIDNAAKLDIPAVLEAIQKSTGDYDLAERISMSASLTDQVAAVADLLSLIQAGSILALESVDFGAYGDRDFSFISDVLLSGAFDRSIEMNRLLAAYGRTRIRQMEESFVVLGWVLEALRFGGSLRTRIWSLLGEPLNDIRGWS